MPLLIPSHTNPLAPNEIACANMLSKRAINDPNFT